MGWDGMGGGGGVFNSNKTHAYAQMHSATQISQP